MNQAQRAFDAARTSLAGGRASNQDRSLVLADADCVLLAVADGLGGHPRGEVAAQLLVDACEALFRRTARPVPDPRAFLLHCIGKAHQAIRRFGGRQDPPIAPRTTAVLALVQGGVASWAHVGDSRLYLLRGGRVFAQTRDHAAVRLVRREAEQAARRLASVTRCLGGLPQPPTTTCGPPTALLPGDTLLLCSDGMWGQLPPGLLVETLSREDLPLDQGLQRLALRASECANSDNVTAVALRWLAGPAQAGTEHDRRAAPGRLACAPAPAAIDST